MIFAPFRIRSFRFQWPADLLTSWAFEMETIVLGWYVIVQTGSVVWLTAFGSLQFLGTLAAPMVGVLGDRLGGRGMLCAMRAMYATLAAVLALLALAGWLTPAWVLVIAAIAGLVRPNDQVMRNALIGETMPPAYLMGALGMSRATMDSARVAGALAGAALTASLGLGRTYLFVTGFYVASLALTFGVARRPPVPDPGASGALARTIGSTVVSASDPGAPGRLATGIRPDLRTAGTAASSPGGAGPSPSRSAPAASIGGVSAASSHGDISAGPAHRGISAGATHGRISAGPAGGAASAGPSRRRELLDGLAHVGRTPELLAMMLLAFLVNLTAYPVSGGLLPYVAQSVYQVDATGLGWLVASFSFGGLLASIATVLMGGFGRPERATLICAALWYVFLLGFGHVQSLHAGLLALLLAGFVQNIAMISMMATILAAAGEGFRGRVMGVRMLAVYGLPLGLIAAGVLIERIGYPLTITAFTVFGLVSTVLIGVRWRASMWLTKAEAAGPRSLPHRV